MLIHKKRRIWGHFGEKWLTCVSGTLETSKYFAGCWYSKSPVFHILQVDTEFTKIFLKLKRNTVGRPGLNRIVDIQVIFTILSGY